MAERTDFRPDSMLWDWMGQSDADSAEVARWLLEERQHQPRPERPGQGGTKFGSVVAGVTTVMFGVSDSPVVSAALSL